jgi:hypothetical protein
MSKQIFLKFATTPCFLADANENFGKKYAELLKNEINKGFLLLPFAFEIFDYGETSQKMSKPVALIVDKGKFDHKHWMEKVQLERIDITKKRDWTIVSTNGNVEVSSLKTL